MPRSVAVRCRRLMGLGRLPLAAVLLGSLLVPVVAGPAAAEPLIFASILTPSTGGALPVGVPLVIAGSATGDGEGQQVDSIEVSVDAGLTWLPAPIGVDNARYVWSIVYTPEQPGELTIVARAAFGNTRQVRPPVPVHVTVGAATAPPAVACPCQLALPPVYGSPELPDPDQSAVELGLRFQVDRPGFITGLRVSRPGHQNGVDGHLWGPDGALLATGVEIGMHEPAQIEFQPPVPVVADQTYVASFFTSVGRYDSAELYFGGVLLNPPFRTVFDEAGGAGVYQYGDAPAFPANTWNRSNYWVTPIFTD